MLHIICLMCQECLSGNEKYLYWFCIERSSLVGSCERNNNDCPFGYWETVCSNWPTSGSFWLTSNPYGLSSTSVINNLLVIFKKVRLLRTFKSMRRLMNYFDQRYNSTKFPIIITENGISSRGNGTDQEPEVKIYFKGNNH